jgi:hypothetical protein
MAVETYGAWADGSLCTLTRVAARWAEAQQESRNAGIQAVFGTLGVALQRANARALLARDGGGVLLPPMAVPAAA